MCVLCVFDYVNKGFGFWFFILFIAISFDAHIQSASSTIYTQGLKHNFIEVFW